ncbi:p115 like vesicle tethering protein [Mycena albidolilacea]|uniref:P115 like vesicle tethering protein n=1 Tax=Mycena albidolilacea TaxID=1033008 RepID=A0AAD7EV60_9AGAR|nr:p115 like vesicle tethering protein [Mycena albidolilacea]
MEFLSQTYVALRGPTGAPQTATDTIGRLSDRLSPATLLADRRAAVQSLKGLARDWKQDVGERALPGLLEVLSNDAEVDADISKAALETLNILCDVEEAKELGFKHTDYVLANDKVIHTLFALLADDNFYTRFATRFATLQYLSTLLQNRRQIVQGYFLKAPSGSSSIMTVLEDKREIIRNEAVTMVQALISQSADIQKVLAFEGAFEKLFNTVMHEGGVEGGAVTMEALACVDGLLRFNTSNQSYFRETPLPPVLCSLLLFPPNLPMHEAAPQEFALQFWDDQKLSNASLIVGIMGMLIGSSKGNSTQEVSAFTRCLVEIALAANAPTPLKTQALRLLPSNLNFPLSELVLTPYCPVPDTNGEEWDRLEPASALDALVELALHGEYNGVDSEKRLKEGLELRAAAVAVFENFVRQDEVRLAILQGMLPAEGASPSEAPPITPLLHALASPPASSSALEPATVTSTHIATLLFAHLLRSSPRAKSLARNITPPSLQPLAETGGTFFVPADGAPPEAPPTPEDDEDDDPPQALLQILSENLSLSSLSRSRADTSERESREWDRLVVAYLCLLSQWLWEDPGAVREFLNAGGLSVLVEAINQTSEVDFIVPGLCAFLLGVCYEFNREPGEITRATIYPILDRLGVETLIGRMARLREDERFKSVGPDTVVLPYPSAATQHLQLQHGAKAGENDKEKEGEIWFDWAFVDFWKSNYYTVQRGLSTEPDQLSSSASGQSLETAMLISSLRDVIRNQTNEIEALQRQLKEKTSAGTDELKTLRDEVSSLSSQLEASEGKRKDVEKEQEDLLVLLDEVSAKRKTDKARLAAAGLEVSEDEADDDDDDGVDD